MWPYILALIKKRHYRDIMKNKIDLEKILNNVDNDKSPTSVAFKSEDINFDLESIKEALNVSDKIFLQIGSFEYDDESYEEPCFIFDVGTILEDCAYDEYYEKYKSDDSGYGIFLDKDLNVEYGYYTKKFTIFDRKFHATCHDFKDARDYDEVKLEIFTILANADIWITADVSMDDFHNKCDLEKLDKLINWENISIFGAFDGKDPDKLGELDLDSFKEALNNYDNIFLELGDFSYSSDDSNILIDTHSGWLTNYDVISDIEYEYYDKYKCENAGYGIYLDKDLNVEYGCYTEEYSFRDNKNYTIFHNLEDARDDDKVKNEIYSILDKLDIWNQYEVSMFPEDKMYCPNCGKRYNVDEKFCTSCRTKLITGILVNERLRAEQEIKNNQIIELSESLDDSSVMVLANRILLGTLWTLDSKETILINMLKQRSFNEIIMMSKNIPKDEYMFFKSFNSLDDESARKFFEYSMDYYPSAYSRELLLRHMLGSYSIVELSQKLMYYKSSI